jgi:diacylglycerol kinase (ATP)
MLRSARQELRRRVKSFQFAIQGWLYIMRTQKNAWIHGVASLSVFAIGLWLGLSRSDWALLTLTIVMVWMAEFMNTALEAIVDMSQPEPHPLAKVAKDVSAAAVLLGACAAVLVGLIILGPPLWQRLSN